MSSQPVTLYGMSSQPRLPEVLPALNPANFAVVTVTEADLMAPVRDSNGALSPPQVYHTVADLQHLVQSLPNWDLKYQLAHLAQFGLGGFGAEEKRLATVYAAVTQSKLLMPLLLADARTAGYLQAWYAWDQGRSTPQLPETMPSIQQNVALHLQIYHEVVAEMISEFIEPASARSNMLLTLPELYVPLLLQRRQDLAYKIKHSYYGNKEAVRVVSDCITAFAALHQVRVPNAWISDTPSCLRLIQCLQNDHRRNS